MTTQTPAFLALEKRETLLLRQLLLVEDIGGEGEMLEELATVQALMFAEMTWPDVPTELENEFPDSPPLGAGATAAAP